VHRVRSIVPVLLALTACAHTKPPECDLVPSPPFLAVADTTPPGVLQGFVLALPDSAPISAAQIVIAGTTRGAIADSAGRFRLTAPLIDSVTIVVRKISYRTGRFRLGLRADHGLRLRIALATSCYQVQF
jgi:carboxypeptidase family protein